MSEEVVLSKEEYNVLLDKAKLLYCLEASCVAEWQGWAEAKKLYNIAYPDQKNNGDFIFVPILEKVYNEMPRVKELDGFIDLFIIQKEGKDFYNYSDLKSLYDNYINNYNFFIKPKFFVNISGTVELEWILDSYWNAFLTVNFMNKKSYFYAWNTVLNKEKEFNLDLKESWAELNNILNKLNNNETNF